jgi:hypothetical protein
MTRLLTTLLFPSRGCGLLGSRSVARHLLRGALAVLSLAWGLPNLSAEPELALGSLAVAVAAMRGCPMCWTVGLVETIVAQARSRG